MRSGGKRDVGLGTRPVQTQLHVKQLSPIHVCKIGLNGGEIIEIPSLKALTDRLEGGVESILIQSLLVNWRLGYFYYLIFKGLIQKINKKPLNAA
jgi:hypothetical protein